MALIKILFNKVLTPKKSCKTILKVFKRKIRRKKKRRRRKKRKKLKDRKDSLKKQK